MTMATRCPACSTVFRVVPDQLRVSAGWVRCGRCGEAFNAIEALTDLDNGKPVVKLAATAAASAETTASGESTEIDAGLTEERGDRARSGLVEAAPSRDGTADGTSAGDVSVPEAVASPATTDLVDASASREGDTGSDSHTAIFSATDSATATDTATDTANATDRDTYADNENTLDDDALRALLARRDSSTAVDDVTADLSAMAFSTGGENGAGARRATQLAAATAAVGDGEAADVPAGSSHSNEGSPGASVDDDSRADRWHQADQWKHPRTVQPPEPTLIDEQSGPSERSGHPSLQERLDDAVAADEPVDAGNVDTEPARAPLDIGTVASVDDLDDSTDARPLAAPSFLRRAERAERWQRPWVRSLIGAGVIASALLLALQVAYDRRDWLVASVPASRPILVHVCELLSCTIGDHRQIEALAVESSGLVRMEGTALYRLSVVLRNRSALEVAAPAIDLSLSDGQGRLIARRVLRMADLGLPLRTLAARSELPIQVSLGVGERAVSGYTVEIFYP